MRHAILRTADHIESNPKLYRFIPMMQPRHDEDGPASVLAWIAYFAGIDPTPSGHYHPLRVAKALGIEHTGIFYDRLHDLCASCSWCSSPYGAAIALRRYADHYRSDPIDFLPMMRLSRRECELLVEARRHLTTREPYICIELQHGDFFREGKDTPQEKLKLRKKIEDTLRPFADPREKGSPTLDACIDENNPPPDQRLALRHDWIDRLLKYNDYA